MRIANMLTKKIRQENNLKKVVGVSFFKDEKSLAKYMLLYSKSKNGKKWVSDERKSVNFGIFKTCEEMFTARALIIGKHKFSLIVGVEA